MDFMERLECAVKLLGDYELSGGSLNIRHTHEWGLIIEEIDNVKRLIKSIKVASDQLNSLISNL